MSNKKSGKKRQNSAALQKERQKLINTASYMGIAIAAALIGIVAGIIFAVSYVPNKVCCTAGGVEIKRDIYECCYFYDTVTSMDLSAYGYDSSKSPYEQEFTIDTIDGDYDTWGDYFEKLTDDTLAFCYGMVKKADETGYSYSDSVQSKVDSDIEAIQKSASEKGVRFESYTHVAYGAKIKEDSLRQYLEVYYKAMDYYDAVVNDKELFFKDFASDEEALKQKYSDMKDSWDIITLRYFLVNEDASQRDEIIEKFRSCNSEAGFKNIANNYYSGDGADQYAQKDGSLIQNYSFSQLSAYISESVKQKLLSAKAGELIEESREIGEEGKKEKVTEFYFVVSPRAQDDRNYENTDILVWEHSAMAKIIDEYFFDYPVEKNEKGMKNFIKHIDIVVPETTSGADES